MAFFVLQFIKSRSRALGLNLSTVSSLSPVCAVLRRRFCLWLSSIPDTRFLPPSSLWIEPSYETISGSGPSRISLYCFLFRNGQRLDY